MSRKPVKKTREVKSFAGGGNPKSPVREVRPQSGRSAASETVAVVVVTALFAALLLAAMLLVAGGRMTAEELLRFVEATNRPFLVVVALLAGPRAVGYIKKRLISGDQNG